MTELQVALDVLSIEEALNIADEIEQLDEDIRKEYNKFNKAYDEKVGRFD